MSIAIVPDAVSVEPLDNYFLKVAFTDGRICLFDFKPFLEWNCYANLKNKAFFKLASIEYGTVVWPGNIDVDPEMLYASTIIA